MLCDVNEPSNEIFRLYKRYSKRLLSSVRATPLTKKNDHKSNSQNAFAFTSRLKEHDYLQTNLPDSFPRGDEGEDRDDSGCRFR